jgi:hypothetical protein
LKRAGALVRHIGEAAKARNQVAARRFSHDWPLAKECFMARCDVCGNDYDKAFQVTMGGQTKTFDSFECAIHAMAPRCAHCECHVIGHGVEAQGKIYCCAHCAKHEGVKGLADRAA